MKTALAALALGCCVAATPAFADTHYLRGQRLTDTLSGQTFTWRDGTSSTYGADGSYVFRGRKVLTGSWRVAGDRVCVRFSARARDCGRYFYKGDALYARTSAGKIYRAK